MAARDRKLGAIAALFPAALFLAAPAAFADQQAKAGNDALPGVEAPKPIVSRDTPYPPEPDTAQNDDPNAFQVGDMKVQIHGYISYAVGFGQPMPGKGYRK